MCGVVGIFGRQPVNQALYDSLTMLQHRGQDAAGIVTCDSNGLHTRKGTGLVRDVFHTRHMRRLKGNVGIGHVRYPTAGAKKPKETQPLYVNSPYGICLAHNGNLVNYDELAEMLSSTDLRHLNTESDSEVLLNVFAHELQKGNHNEMMAERIFKSITELHKRVSGGYAVVSLIANNGIVAFRDPHGIRPLILGRRETTHGLEYMIASESVALDVLDFERVRDVEPGECIYIDNKGRLHSKVCAPKTQLSPCIFEYVYLARPDSIIDGLSVYKSRLRIGEQLGEKILEEWPDHDIDVVIPIPDTSRVSAVQVAHRLGLKLRDGFVKNRYVPRTFIMPGQELREKSVKQKLNTIDLEFAGKNVLLVDDSIVRGTTSREIIKIARQAGANMVYFAVAAPPVRYPNVYGINMPSTDELIAHDCTEEEVEELIGADKLIYLELSALIQAVQYEGVSINNFDTSCFSGEYITGDVTEEYLNRLANKRDKK